MAIGDPNLYFGRDTKVYAVQGANIWEIPVLGGYTFRTGTNTADVTASEMADASGNSRRGRKRFTNSLSPAEWSFSTYVRPYLITGTPNRVRSIEEVLWANFIAPNGFTAATPAWTAGVTYGPTTTDFDFTGSNKTTLGVFDLYFVLGGANSATANYAASEVTTIYRVKDCSINEVAISFEIDGIATLAWSGMGGKIDELVNWDATGAIRDGVDATNNFIRNRLTQLAATSSVSGSAKTYLLTLTGGTITLTNNLTYLTPELIGRVNVPIGHVTGGRTIGGSFTCYLDEKTNGSIDLFQDLTGTTALGKMTNAFALDFFVGGKAAGDAPVAPGIQFKMPAAHLSIPSFDNGDLISVSVDFAALPSNIGVTDEVTAVRYAGIVPA